MEISHEQWRKVSSDFASLSMEGLRELANNFMPDSDIDINPARIDDQNLQRIYTDSMAEALLSIIHVR